MVLDHAGGLPGEVVEEDVNEGEVPGGAQAQLLEGGGDESGLSDKRVGPGAADPVREWLGTGDTVGREAIGLSKNIVRKIFPLHHRESIEIKIFLVRNN